MTAHLEPLHAVGIHKKALERDLELADMMLRQSELNERIGRALQAIALQADRYDEELALVREQLSAIGARLADFRTRLDTLERPRPAGVDENLQ